MDGHVASVETTSAIYRAQEHYGLAKPFCLVYLKGLPTDPTIWGLWGPETVPRLAD